MRREPELVQGRCHVVLPEPDEASVSELTPLHRFGFLLRHCADVMNVDGESGALLTRRHEDISDSGKHRDETLQAANRSKSLHYPLSFSKRHVRILGAIVQAFMRSMLDAGYHIPSC